VSTTLLAAIQAAISAAVASDGRVDPTLLDALERAGYAESFVGKSPAPLAEAVADANARRPASPRPDRRWAQIQVQERERLVRLPEGVRIDLGGTAKGMAVDIAARMLVDCPAFAVDAGGDIRTGGASAIPRLIEIAHPLRDEPAYRFELTAGAVATSGLRTRIWKTVDGYAHHLIDPASGLPAWTGVIQATALAPTALEAETLAKTAVLRGPLAGRVVLERHGGALILDTGKVIVVRNLTAAGLAGPAAVPTVRAALPELRPSA
jgi:thiamine biosynthesis lipoprotein